MTTCEAENWTKGTVVVFRDHPQVLQRYRGKETVFIRHLRHVGICSGDWFCVKVEHPEMPEKVVLARRAMLEEKGG